MTMSPNYRIYKQAENILVAEQVKKIKITGKAISRNEMANELIEQYPVLIKRINDLQTKGE